MSDRTAATADPAARRPCRSHRAPSPALVLALVLPLAVAGCGGAEQPEAPEAAAAGQAHRAEVEAWHQKRIERLTAEDGWLSLVGLAWLGPGENPTGSKPDSIVVLPDTAPPEVGAFVVDGDAVAFEARGRSGVAVVGEDGLEPVPPGGRVPLLADTAEGGPTVLAVGSLRFFVIDRDGRLGVRVRDPEGPARRGFVGIETFPVDPAWRIEARLDPYDPPHTLAVPTILGTVSDSPSPGAVVFEVDGKSYRLDAVAEPGDADLFLVFGDRTNGDTTYGAGRFLYAEAPAPDDPEHRVVVDFNRAYNPPCAFTPFATCPLPPPGNRLPFAVEAGEKNYALSVH
jgi:uncharacterized protein (DUF1684 family)